MGRGGLGDLLGKLVIGAIGYLVADAVTKSYTGKHIHEHAYVWFRQVHDAAVKWAMAQDNRDLLRILAVMDSIVTEGYVRFGKLRVFGVSPQRESPALICENKVPYEELVKKFGTMRQGYTYDVTQLMLEG